MKTVKTINTDERKVGWVFYDGSCRVCRRLARACEPALGRRRFRIAPLQEPWVAARLGMHGSELLLEMRVLNPEGNLFGGVEAIAELSREFWWARWLAALANVSAGRELMNRAYRWVAARRHCGAGACDNAGETTWVDLLPLLLLALAAVSLAFYSPGWVLMWSMAAALFFGVKWLAWRDGHGLDATALRSIGFLLLWPGMDARRFLHGATGTAGRKTEWLGAIAKACLGAVLVWVAARAALNVSPLLAGWVGMIGLVLCLHFGLFHLISLAWRTHGVDAAPIMNAPLRAVSLAEFWGRRWNQGFSTPARQLIHRPLATRLGCVWALLGVFLVSGVLHELVISFPARAGYGLPTGYFVLQGIGMLVERSKLGLRFGLSSGSRGWGFTMICAAAPAFWLFHPNFVHRVILPFLQAIGAI